jgi:membrane associated rhomboid family serine protease
MIGLGSDFQRECYLRLMLIPLRTDRQLRHTPWVNYTLIAINVIIFLMTEAGRNLEAMAPYMLWPGDPAVLSFVSYQFLHADWMHLLGNMLFLFVFGNSVEDRFGKVGYLGFYLAGGIFAGLGHVLVEQAPVLGASGAVCAVTGAYLALFPMSNVSVIFLFFIITWFQISSLYLILFQVAYNVVFSLLPGGGNVAYLAHLVGYAFGFAIGMGLLGLRILSREPYDLLSMIEQRRRRQQFRSLTRQGYQPWERPAPGMPAGGTAPVVSAEEKQLMELRAQISQAWSEHDLATAATMYERLMGEQGTQVMPRQQQLDIANKLTETGRHESAARAYELYLGTYKADAQREEVELILALIYTRYLQRRQRARELIAQAMSRLHEPHQRQLAQMLLSEIEAA